MDKLVYTAATGLRAHMAAQAAIANNMANASTTGFRADRVVFDRFELKGGGASSRRARRPSEEVTDADRRAGRDPADRAPARRRDHRRRRWLAVQAADGQRGVYPPRRPEVAPSGVLQTGDGFIVMGRVGADHACRPTHR